MKKKLLGHVGVDSGQLLITDPCYIDSSWEKENCIDTRIYKHKKTKKLFKYANPSPSTLPMTTLKPNTEIFQHFEAKTSTGKTISYYDYNSNIDFRCIIYGVF